ncbi:diphthine--ammonia ligase [Alkalibacillus salilacus]|uniref:Uncharacterized protein (TIGR00290 family) n=1 Tax=Alkalibacillus salilacus TaxID=284582 RepID=A0ABT9VFH6_9BACI|nr:diphthine--ammonia ligase [Alkalibacillus salilacus]MDQ0159729.1 uncharacterized protein (TIGR00290 family) [Alkalibacillus salilacus]
MKRVAVSHSGGKDSMLALYHMLNKNDVIVDRLIATIDENNRRTSVHETKESLMSLQADALGLPLQKIYIPSTPSNDEYNERMYDGLRKAEQDGVTHIVYGDINLADVRAFRESQLKNLQLDAIFPLWQQSTTILINEFLSLGFETWITTIDPNRVPNDFLGARLDHETLQALPDSIDPCGENGEFHTLVVDGPLFHQSLPVQLSNTVIEGAFYTYHDVQLKDSST